MSFLVALSLVIGIAASGLSIYEFLIKKRASGTIYAAVAAVLIIAAIIISTIPIPSGSTASGNNEPGNTPTSTISPQQGTTVTTIPTSPPTAILPCNVDVGTWTGGSPDWKTLNGVLLNDGTRGSDGAPGGPTIVAPCQLGNATNYAVETKIQVTSRDFYYKCFGIAVRGSSASNGWQGYQAGTECQGYGTLHLGGVWYDGGVAGPFDPGQNLHTYRVEVNGNVITFLVDGSPLLTLTDNRYLTGSQVGLFEYGLQLQVASFVVTAL